MQRDSVTVRQASARDAAACVEIYRPYVERTAISWEIDVPSTAEMAARITALGASHEWLVLASDDEIVGFAYAQTLKRMLPAVQWATETGIYVDADQHRAGYGTQLYAELLRRLAERGYRQAVAGITQPNEASNRFHRSLGFEDAGRYKRLVWKLDDWHDVAWMQRDLLGGQHLAPEPITRSSQPE